MKYTGDASDGISSVKRLYADIIITKPCPECGEDTEHDFNDSYISYGEATVYFYCDNCEHEWDIEADVTATVTVETKE